MSVSPGQPAGWLRTSPVTRSKRDLDTSAAMRRAVDSVASVEPQFVGVLTAEQAIPRMSEGVVLHAGPSIEPWRMCGPMRAATAVGMALEGIAGRPRDALELMDSGEVELIHNHDVGCVGLCVSGGAEHQGPPGGGPVAVVWEPVPAR